MADSVSGKKQTGVGPRPDISHEKEARSSDVSIHKSSAEDSVRYKNKKELSVCKSSEEYFEYSCDPCTSAGDHVEAQGFCTDCVEYLCGMCFRSHSRNKLSKHHTLLDKDTMPRKSVKTCDPCKAASEEAEAEGYCEDCNEYLCEGCYKSHSRSKLSRHHVLLYKNNMPAERDISTEVASSLPKTNTIDEGAVHQKCTSNEEYTYVTSIDIQSEKEHADCRIEGITPLPSGYLVLADSANQSLKLVDVEASSVIDCWELQMTPLGITTISKDKIAVVLDGQHKILIISVLGGLSLVRAIETKGYCLDIKHINGRLYVSFKDPVMFQILQPNGVVHKIIKPDPEVLKHCSLPRHIAVSPDEGTIYVSDEETNKVISINTTGNLISMYHGELSRPTDIAISPFGSVYVCDRNQDVLYMMMSDLSGAIMKLDQRDGFRFPLAVCFNVVTEHLCISGDVGPEYMNFIRVYQWN